MITALPGDAGQAELTTDQGAIYVTNNKAYTWSAAVLETVDATLNRTVSSGEQQTWYLMMLTPRLSCLAALLLLWSIADNIG